MLCQAGVSLYLTLCSLPHSVRFPEKYHILHYFYFCFTLNDKLVLWNCGLLLHTYIQIFINHCILRWLTVNRHLNVKRLIFFFLQPLFASSFCIVFPPIFIPVSVCYIFLYVIFPQNICLCLVCFTFSSTRRTFIHNSVFVKHLKVPSSFLFL